MSGIEWKGPWRAVERSGKVDELASLQRELSKELTDVHPLASLEPRVIGRCSASDDIVVELNDGRLAIVHLTWCGKPDQFPDKFPDTTIYSSVAEFNDAIDIEWKNEDGPFRP